MHSEDVQEELDELCELWGIAKRDVPPNERSNDRDRRTKQLRELFYKRKAERLKAIEAAGHARVVAAAGRPGAVERPDGVTALAGQTFAASAIERAGGRVTGVRVFPAASGSSGVLISVEFLEPAAAPSAGAGAGAAGAGAAASGAGAVAASGAGAADAGLAAAAAASGAAAASAHAPPPPLPPAPATPAACCWSSDSSPDSAPSWVDRAWEAAVGDREAWFLRRGMARLLGRPFGPDWVGPSKSPVPRYHPPGCPCGRPTCPVPLEERIAPMVIDE